MHIEPKWVAVGKMWILFGESGVGLNREGWRSCSARCNAVNTAPTWTPLRTTKDRSSASTEMTMVYQVLYLLMNNV